MSEQPSTGDEGSTRQRTPGGAYISALLIALALLALVILARPRQSSPLASALPTSTPTFIPPTPTPTIVATTAAQTPVPNTPTPPPAPPTATATPTPAPITVYVAGAVRRPGNYTLSSGSRVGDAVDKAGGMTKKADPIAINLAQRLEDGMQVTVPARGQVLAPTPTPTVLPPTATALPAPATPAPTERPNGEPTRPTDTPAEDTPPAGPININTASQEDLETLPGIGPSKAAAIIEYRQQHGPFARIEDLQEVKGIGPKTFEALSDKVTV